MPEPESPATFFPIALLTVLIAAIAVAWSPRYWPLAVAVTGISIVTALWAILDGQIRIAPRKIPLITIVALISIWGLVQLAAHLTIAPWLTIRVALNWLAYGATFFIASQLLRSEPSRRLFLSGLLWSSAAFAVIAMLQMYSEPVRVYGIFPADSTVVGTFLYKNQFAALMELVAPIALWRAFSGRDNPIAGGAIFIVIFAAVVASASRAGVILIVAELFATLLIMLFRRKIPVTIAFSITGILALLLAAASLIAGPERILAHFQERNPYSVRKQLTLSTIKMVAEKPWIGAGMGTWRIRYPRFATFDNSLLANEAHNDWVQWASEGGIPFALLMALLVAGVAKPSVESVWGLGVLAVMIHSFIDYPTREPAVGLVWFALAGTASVWQRERPLERIRVRKKVVAGQTVNIA